MAFGSLIHLGSESQLISQSLVLKFGSPQRKSQSHRILELHLSHSPVSVFISWKLHSCAVNSSNFLMVLLIPWGSTSHSLFLIVQEQVQKDSAVLGPSQGGREPWESAPPWSPHTVSPASHSDFKKCAWCRALQGQSQPWVLPHRFLKGYKCSSRRKPTCT